MAAGNTAIQKRFAFEKGRTRGGGTAPPGLSFRGKKHAFSAKQQAVWGLKRKAFETENAQDRPLSPADTNSRRAPPPCGNDKFPSIYRSPFRWRQRDRLRERRTSEQPPPESCATGTGAIFSGCRIDIFKTMPPPAMRPKKNNGFGLLQNSLPEISMHLRPFTSGKTP